MKESICKMIDFIIELVKKFINSPFFKDVVQTVTKTVVDNLIRMMEEKYLLGTV